ncbi:hypothetical protein RBB50_012871 [Rhinocladiella similis]
MSVSTRLIEALNQLQGSAKYSDLALVCQGQEFHVHRAIVCPQSKFFEAACGGDFKEAHSNRIELEDDDPATVERMITFMYTFNYNDEQHQDPESDDGGCASSAEAAEVSIGETCPTRSSLHFSAVCECTPLQRNMAFHS